MRTWGVGVALIAAMFVYGCSGSDHIEIGSGGSGGSGGTGGMAGSGGMGGMAGTGGMAGSGGMGGMGGVIAPTPSSCLDLRDAGETMDGTYMIEVNGSPLTVNCDMNTDGGGWTQLYDQNVNVAPFYRSIAEWEAGVSTGDPNSEQYSILNLIDEFEGASLGFEFMIDWPNDGTSFVQWEQADNPFNGRSAVSNEMQFPTAQVGCTSFDGLANDANNFSTLDGSTGSCAWWAIGTNRQYGVGIPAYSDSAAGALVATRARLWVR